MRSRRLFVALALAALASVAVPFARGHPERATQFPTGAVRPAPKYRNTGTALVVCRSDSAKRLKKIFKESPETLARR